VLKEGEISLRAIGPDDRALLVRWQSDPAIMRGWGLPQPLLPHDAFCGDLNDRFTRFDVAGDFLIVAPVGPVGRIFFTGLESRHRCAQIGLYVGETGQQGKGYGGAAIKALVRYLVHQRDVHRIELTTLTWNAKAHRLYTRLGFQDEGLLREYLNFDGEWHGEMQMSLLATDPIPWLAKPVTAQN